MSNEKSITYFKKNIEVSNDKDTSRYINLSKNSDEVQPILTVKELDRIERYKAACRLLADLKEAEEESDRDGWLSAEEVERELGLRD